MSPTANGRNKMANGTPGRNPRLTNELKKRLLDILGAGVPRSIACPAVGISDRTLRIWLSRAEAGEEPYLGFAEELEEHIARSKASLVVELRKAAKKDWRAASWLLERTDHKNFGMRAPVVDSDNGYAPIQIAIKTHSKTEE